MTAVAAHLLLIPDDPDSVASGSVIDGIFDGQITTGIGENFFMEKSVKFFDSAPFHSIIYSGDKFNTSNLA